MILVEAQVLLASLLCSQITVAQNFEVTYYSTFKASTCPCMLEGVCVAVAR